MFFHNFKYTLKVLLKNRSLVFWTLCWPLILGTMFYLAFSNISENEKLKTIKVGIVDNIEYNSDTTLKNTLQSLSIGDTSLLDITYGSEEELKTLLNDKDIEGYIIKNDKIDLIVKANGINQTIIKYILEQIGEYNKLGESLYKNGVDTSTIYKNIMSNKTYLNNLSGKTDYVVIEYYSLIAMTVLYGSLLTSYVISNYLANINKKGARISVSPVSRLKLVLSGFLSSFLVQVFTVLVLLFYTLIVLKVDYGSSFNLVLLLSLIGTLTGSSIGLLIGSISFKNENTKTGVLLFITMLGCFFAGMMGISMKYIVDKNIPLLNMINPASIITDGFYSLYYYKTLNRFYFDIVSLIIISVLLLIISVLIIRRKKYDSI